MSSRSHYSITLMGDRPDGRASWSVTCGCGWYQWGLCSRRAAESALERHRKLDWMHGYDRPRVAQLEGSVKK